VDAGIRGCGPIAWASVDSVPDGQAAALNQGCHCTSLAIARLPAMVGWDSCEFKARLDVDPAENNSNDHCPCSLSRISFSVRCVSLLRLSLSIGLVVVVVALHDSCS
jgi:hypothetical protein